MDYTLNADDAKQAEYTGTRIDRTGRYEGKFLYAEDIIAKTGALGIDLNFEDIEQRKTKLTLYTVSKDGKPIFGRNMLMAIMTCMKVKELKAEAGIIEKYDFDTGKEKKTEASIYPALVGKPIGLLLQAEEYAKSGGGVGVKMNIAGVFEAATGLTASEILDKKTTPEKLPKMVAALRDKPLKGAATAVGAPASGKAGFADLDDDIPF